MSLGQPALYIAGQKMQTAKEDPRPVLSGLKFSWGSESRFEFDPPHTLSGQILVRGQIPEHLHAGAEVGLVDPATSRTLFAGYMQPLTAAAEPTISGAYRVSFSASSPRTELEKHTVLDLDWPEESAGARKVRLANSLPSGWTFAGAAGFDWINQGRQRYSTIEWLVLAERYLRGNLLRHYDTSVYVPGSGLQKRLTIAAERPRSAALATAAPGTQGVWVAGNPTGTAGTAVLPAGVVDQDIEWAKTPEDMITGIQVSTWGMSLPSPLYDGQDSKEHEWPLDYGVDHSAERRAYGLRLLRVETALTPQGNDAERRGAAGAIAGHWMDTQNRWRPTRLRLPDSRRISTAALLSLLAVDTRGTAAVSVPQVVPTPGPIRSFVLGGTATWTGRQWDTELILGRIQS